VSIYQEGNDLRERVTGVVIGSLMAGANNIVKFKPATGARLIYPRLWEITQLVEQMTRPLIQREQSGTPTPGTEDANRPRIMSTTGGRDLFRSVGGFIGNSDPIGSIEDGPVFVPAPGVNFSHDELSQIAQLLRQGEAVRA
jgi:hypothetical protein